MPQYNMKKEKLTLESVIEKLKNKELFPKQLENAKNIFEILEEEAFEIIAFDDHLRII